MHDSNGHISATEMVAEIGDQRPPLSCRRRLPGRPSQVCRQAGRRGDGTKHGERRP